MIALTRAVSESLAECQLTFLGRAPIDVERARAQHAAYVRALESLGARVVHLAPADDLPDAVFVEDPVVVLDECAVALRMGALVRRPEVESVAAAVAEYRPVVWMEGPDATMDGGDVLRIGRELFVGRSTRTNEAGVEALRRVVEPYGYRVVPVEVNGCLHLKTGCSWAGRHLLIRGEWIDPAPFAHLDTVEVPAAEPMGANVLALADRVVVSASHPETEGLLQRLAYRTIAVDIAELEKAEAGLTCMSVIFRAGSASPA